MDVAQSYKKTEKQCQLTLEQFHNYAEKDPEDHHSKWANDLMGRSFHLYERDGKMTGMFSMYCADMLCQYVPTLAWIKQIESACGAKGENKKGKASKFPVSKNHNDNLG